MRKNGILDLPDPEHPKIPPSKVRLRNGRMAEVRLVPSVRKLWEKVQQEAEEAAAERKKQIERGER